MSQITLGGYMATVHAALPVHTGSDIETGQLEEQKGQIREDIAKTRSVVDQLLDAVNLQRDESGAWTLCNMITFTWRDLVMLGGIIAAVTLAVASFFAGSIATGVGFALAGTILLIGEYWVHQLTDLLPFNELSVAFQSLIKGSSETSHSMANLLLSFLDALGIEKEEILARAQELTGQMKEGVGGLKEEVALLQAVRETIDARSEQHLIKLEARHAATMTAEQRVRDELRMNLLRLERVLGQIEEGSHAVAQLRQIASSLARSDVGLATNVEALTRLTAQVLTHVEGIRGERLGGTGMRTGGAFSALSTTGALVGDAY